MELQLRTTSTHRTGRDTARSAIGRVRRETGAALALVLVFMIVGGLIVGALTTAAANGLRNTTNFAVARSLQYDLDNAMNMAIQSVRYTPLLTTSLTLNASPPTSCSTANLFQITGANSSGNVIDVWCSTAWNAMSTATRVVTLSACSSSVSSAQCAANPLLQAVVSFDDYPVGASATAAAQCVVYCGTLATINSWVRSPTVPIVSAVSPNAGPLTGGTAVTLTGSGFVTGSTVNFVEESGGVPTVDNVVLLGTSVVVVSSTSITAVTPAAPATELAATYFVTVTTPTGTSPYSAVFTF